jgi:hypothetical protein
MTISFEIYENFYFFLPEFIFSLKNSNNIEIKMGKFDLPIINNYKKNKKEVTKESSSNDGNESNSNSIIENKKSNTTFRTALGENIKDHVVLVATILAVALGIGIGFLLRRYNFNSNEIAYFRLAGDLFLRMLKFLIFPLIGSSLIAGIAGLGSSNAGKIAGISLLYYFVTTFLAVITGIILVVAIKPGKGIDISAAPEAKLSVDPSKVTTTDTMLDLIRYQVLY